MAKKSARASRSASVRKSAAAIGDAGEYTFALREMVYRLWNWMTGPDSHDEYLSLGKSEQNRFDELARQLSQLHFKMQSADLAALASRASVQMGDLNAAVSDLRRRLDEQQRLADTLASISAFVNLLVPLLL
jgi:hypothetical protein